DPDPAVALEPVEGLDAERVAGGEEGLVALVPEGEAEDPVEAGDAVGAPLLVGVDYHLAVGVRRKSVAGGLELGPHAEVVVDLAVGDDVALSVLGVEGLVAAGEVDDRQPGVDQRRRPVAADRLAVGSAVAQRLADRAGRRLGQGLIRAQYRRYAAHGAYLIRVARGRWRRAQRPENGLGFSRGPG